MLCAGPYRPCQTAVGAYARIKWMAQPSTHELTDLPKGLSYMNRAQRAIDEHCMPPCRSCQPLGAPRKIILYQNSSISAVSPSNYVIVQRAWTTISKGPNNLKCDIEAVY
eukprot:scaffold291671_cov38-Prasinocladus_malaysianus.AAC.1